MEKNNNFIENAEAVFKGLNTFLTTKTVVGEPIAVGDATIIPLVDVSCGMATGAFSENSKERGSGGMGAKISPSAMLIIQKGSTKLVHVKNQDAISKLLDMVPELINKITSRSDVDKDTEEKAKAALKDSKDKYIDISQK